MPKGENSGGSLRKPSLIEKDGHDREGFGLSLIETGEALNMTKAAVYEAERRAIRKIWRASAKRSRRLTLKAPK